MVGSYKKSTKVIVSILLVFGRFIFGISDLVDDLLFTEIQFGYFFVAAQIY